MSNYLKLRTNSILAKPVANIDLGSSSATFGNLYLSNKIYISDTEISLDTLLIPRITSIVYSAGRSTANVSGYETLTINGSGFASGAVVLVEARPVDETTFVSSTELTFTTPERSAGIYSLIVVNPDGGTGASSTGITYS